MKFLAAIWKEFLEISHDRTMFAVLLVFPIFVMIFMGSSFQSMEIQGLPIGVSGATNTTFASMLFSGLNGSTAFKLQEFASDEDAMTAFRNGRLRAVIVVPENFDQKIIEGNGSQITIVVDNSDLALEQAVLAAMSSVLQASSASITKTYVYNAWDQLRTLNGSAASLSGQISTTKEQMAATKSSLNDIRDEIDAISISELEGSLEGASQNVNELKTQLQQQKGAIADMSEGNELMFNRSEEFLLNATYALNQSISTVEDTHARLGRQDGKLNDTVAALDASITGLTLIRDGSSDSVGITALNLNIDSLQSLRDTTETQIIDVREQMAELEELNATLHTFEEQLDNYSTELRLAQGSTSRLSELQDTLENVSSSLDELNSSFASAKVQVKELKNLLAGIRTASIDIEKTLDAALVQASSVDNLIGSLQSTVAEQTGRDPSVIASPLSVNVRNQYMRTSFVDFIMPQVIAVSLLLSCFFLGAISIVREKTRKTVVRALMVPGALANLVVGKIATLMLLSFGQVLIIIVVAALLFGVTAPGDLVLLASGAGISALVLSSIGILVGFYARSESAAIQSCLLLAIPMLFLGNIIFSPDLLPVYTQILQQLLPLAHVTNIFKVILITGGDPSGDIMALLSYFVLLAGLLTYVIMTRKDITNYQ